MHREITKRLLLTLSILWAFGAFAQTSSDQPEQILSQLLKAIADRDYPQFIASGTEDFRSTITPEQFAAVANQIDTRLQKNYQAIYLTSLKQQGFQVHLWKVSFADGGDDHLAKLTLDGEKVAGFWIQ